MAPGLDDGDIVLADLTRQFGDGVFVVRIGNNLCIKRLQWLTDGSLRIGNDNPLYHTEVLAATEDGSYPLTIIGACRIRIGRIL